MIHEYPEYYTEFACIGGSCKDSCCIGWELDIDEETYNYYKNVQGDFGDRLRVSMHEDEENTFTLKDDGRCPFLNEDNLCDIYIILGEESLCNVCTEYPRNHEIIGDYKQSDIGLSCLECARMHFTPGHHIDYIIRKDKIDGCEKLDADAKKRLKTILIIRDTFIYVIRDNLRGLCWQEKAACILRFAEVIQRLWNEDDYRLIAKECRRFKRKFYRVYIEKGVQDNDLNNKVSGEDTASREQILGCINELELLHEDLKIIVNRYMDVFDERLWMQFNNEVNDSYNLWHEQILIYYIYRYLIRAFYDNNIITKVTMAVYSAMVIQCMDYVRWYDSDHGFTLEDRIDIAHIYAKEIEHSDANLESLEEEFIFGNEYNPEHLIKLL